MWCDVYHLGLSIRVAPGWGWGRGGGSGYPCPLGPQPSLHVFLGVAMHGTYTPTPIPPKDVESLGGEVAGKPLQLLSLKRGRWRVVTRPLRPHDPTDAALRINRRHCAP